MFLHNDTKAAKNYYEQLLVKYKMPRMFWRHTVNQVAFADYQITRTIEGRKKPEQLRSISGETQTNYWNNLRMMVRSWNPAAADSPDEHFVLLCCENEKEAQMCLFSLMHDMLRTAHRNPASPLYRIGLTRAFELPKLLEIESALEAPNVVITPTLSTDLTSWQASALRELFTGSYRMFAATALTPQKFFDRFHYLPAYIFYVEKVLSIQEVK